MFDTLFRAASDAEVVAAIEEWAGAEARAAARRLAAIAELVRRRCGDDDRAHWACDAWDATAAEVSAALGIMHGRASGQMHLGQALCRRLPRVAALFMAGRLSYRIFAAIAWRTDLVQDEEAIALIDSAIADNFGRWGPMSDYKLEQAIDKWVVRYDPGALRQTRASARSRDVQIGTRNDQTGTTALFGRLYTTDAALLDRRLMQMAHGVCDDDPRTIAQRRADALGALAAGSDRLTCTCGSPGCTAADEDGRAASVVIHVLADADALAAQPDPEMSGEPAACRPTGRDTTLDFGEHPSDESGAGIIGRRGIVPAPLLAELIRSGSKVRHLRRPGAAPEPGYRPSAALDEFVRFRDMTCRFPNCDQPATHCDVDHSVPWPLGPTHPSNLKCLCRKHHLLKTFWGGPGGWVDRQLPDGSVIWTSPAGKCYTTLPGSRLFFPTWDPTTAGLIPAVNGEHRPARGIMMPIRRRSRAAERAFRIKCERARNDALVSERNRPPPF
jgi:hypothetical protein